jgi:diacylglycerol kinase (ATP)
MTSALAGAPPRTGRAALIINPISGHGAHGRRLAEHIVQARATLAGCGVEVDIEATGAPGDGRRLAAAAVERDVSLVIAWGGDGTINEIASALVSTDIPLGIVPAGSGNGLARDLGLPADPVRALRIAAGTVERRIDAGSFNGELFFNVAGIGLDARIAERFAARGADRRGFGAYLRISARELSRYQPREYSVSYDDQRLVRRALMISVANSRQFGNGAQIAPRARLDDGALDLVMVEQQSLLRVAARIPALFRGTLTERPGIVMRKVRAAVISTPGELPFHVDGEPRLARDSVRVTTHPRALTVRVERA